MELGPKRAAAGGQDGTEVAARSPYCSVGLAVKRCKNIPAMLQL
jgi:hypothetical protein